jgi:Flp pilus assembly protein TadG
MLEFVLVLPFIWLILALTLNFGMALVERQRAMVAIRELAMRHSAALASDLAAPIDPAVAAITAQTLQARGMAGRFTYAPREGTCPRDGEGADDAPVRDVFGVFGAFLNDASSSQSYRLTATGRPLVGRLLEPQVHSHCFAIDGGSWTYRETGDPVDWLKNQIGGLGREVAKAVF